jgi:hypothetical protein
MAYATLAELKTYLGISDTGDDTLLTDLLSRAQKAIETFCDRVFEAASDSTRYFDAVEDTDNAWLFFDEDICSITAITNNEGDESISSSEYVTVPRNDTPYYAIKLLSSSNKYWTYTNDPESAIAVTGKWAYSETAPDDIKQATIRLAAWLYRQKDTETDVDRPILTGDGIVIMPSALPKDVQQLCEPYRKRV